MGKYNNFIMADEIQECYDKYLAAVKKNDELTNKINFTIHHT